MPRLISIVALALSLAGCSSFPTPASSNVQTRESLVRALEQMGYGVDLLPPQIFFSTPVPVAAYRVAQPDGLVLALLAYSPADADRNRLFSANSVEFDRSSGNTLRMFQRGSVAVYVYGYSSDTATSAPPLAQTQLYTDLGDLLGSPRR